MIEASDVNDHSPVFEQLEYHVAVSEGDLLNSRFLQVTATDDDLGMCPSYLTQAKPNLQCYWVWILAYPQLFGIHKLDWVQKKVQKLLGRSMK